MSPTKNIWHIKKYIDQAFVVCTIQTEPGIVTNLIELFCY